MLNQIFKFIWSFYECIVKIPINQVLSKRYINMSSVTVSYRYNHIGIATNTCKLRLFQGNSFLNIIYSYKKIKGKCCCIVIQQHFAFNLKKKKKYTSFRFENIWIQHILNSKWKYIFSLLLLKPFWALYKTAKTHIHQTRRSWCNFFIEFHLQLWICRKHCYCSNVPGF